MVLVEAMGCAVPVVAMDCPSGPVEILTDGVDGFLIPLGDVPALAAAMSKLMDDPSLRDEMGARARETAARFGPQRVWADWERVIERVAAKSRA
jgi:glycosyltransferase involved in cell wall biosynthesis